MVYAISRGSIIPEQVQMEWPRLALTTPYQMALYSTIGPARDKDMPEPRETPPHSSCFISRPLRTIRTRIWGVFHYVYTMDHSYMLITCGLKATKIDDVVCVDRKSVV